MTEIYTHHRDQTIEVDPFQTSEGVGMVSPEDRLMAKARNLDRGTANTAVRFHSRITNVSQYGGAAPKRLDEKL
jgi:hypothetical protein